jgi:REP element-mobilizing transposase RayT
MMNGSRKDRKWLRHNVPSFVTDKSPVFFITICTANRRVSTLTNPETGSTILETVQYRFSINAWYPHIFLLMPDHLHGLVSLPRAAVLKNTVRSFKSWTARYASVDWQQGFFDHRLRSDESLDEKREYISLNPVRAKLVRSPELWPWTWHPPGAGGAK